jgi:hypothetical protein
VAFLPTLPLESGAFLTAHFNSLLGGLQQLELFSMGLDPAFVDFDGECPDQAQSALLVGEDAKEMGAALQFLINAFEHIGALKMLVVLSRQPVKGEGLLDILFDPGAKFGGIFPASAAARRSDPTGFGGVAPVVEPSQLNEAIVAAFAWQIVEGIAQEMHVVRQPPDQ